MLIDYRRIQSSTRLDRVERANFVGEKGQMQWWYVDILMHDGGVLMIAYVPKKWWPDVDEANLDDGFLMVSLLRAGQSEVLSINVTLDPSTTIVSEQELAYEIPSALRITRTKDGYTFHFELDEIRGQVDLQREASVFSAFPWGSLPGWGRTLLLGGGAGRDAFNYVTCLPRGRATGQLTLHGEQVAISGPAYHEQGRFIPPAEALSRGWFWCHFLHPEWNVFGSPGLFLYVQRGTEEPVFRGLNVFGKNFELENRRSTRVPKHPKVYCGGDMRFEHKDLTLTIHAEPDGQTPLISFPSATTRQIYHTLVTDAQMTVKGRGGLERVDGRMIFETCWLAV